MNFAQMSIEVWKKPCFSSEKRPKNEWPETHTAQIKIKREWFFALKINSKNSDKKRDQTQAQLLLVLCRRKKLI